MSQVLYFNEMDREACRVTNEAREWTRRFVAKVSHFGGHIQALRDHKPELMPARYQNNPLAPVPHPEDPLAFPTDWWPEQRGGSRIFDITVEYSTEAPSKIENPLEEEASIEWETAEQLATITRDHEGKLIQNKAGVLIPDVQESLPLWVIDVTKNVARVPGWLLEYHNVVNEDTVRIEGHTFKPRTLHLQRVKIPAKLRTTEGLLYRQIQLQLVYNKETWDRQLLNQGYQELALKKQKVLLKRYTRSVLTGGIVWYAFSHQEEVERVVKQLVPITTPEGEPVSEPVLLDEYGRRPRVDRNGQTITDPLEDGIPKEPLEESDIIVLKFQTKKPVPFSVLPLR